jgi:hypothetical protein
VTGAQRHLDSLFRDLVATCDALGNVRLLFKLHPDDEKPPEAWLALLRPHEGKCLLEVTATRPLAECFDMADAMMTIASTTCLEAIGAGIPVGLIDYLPVEWYLPVAESGAALPVGSRAQLQEAVRALLFDPILRHELFQRGAGALEDELHLQDGHSAERIVNFMEEALPCG